MQSLNLNSAITENSLSPSDEAIDPRVLSSVMISVKLSQTLEEPNATEDPHARLLELMHSAPTAAILKAGKILARDNGIENHAALQQIILNLKEIDKLWTKVLLKEGINRLSSQYH